MIYIILLLILTLAIEDEFTNKCNVFLLILTDLLSLYYIQNLWIIPIKMLVWAMAMLLPVPLISPADILIINIMCFLSPNLKFLLWAIGIGNLHFKKEIPFLFPLLIGFLLNSCIY